MGLWILAAIIHTILGDTSGFRKQPPNEFILHSFPFTFRLPSLSAAGKMLVRQQDPHTILCAKPPGAFQNLQQAANSCCAGFEQLSQLCPLQFQLPAVSCTCNSSKRHLSLSTPLANLSFKSQTQLVLGNPYWSHKTGFAFLPSLDLSIKGLYSCFVIARFLCACVVATSTWLS